MIKENEINNIFAMSNVRGKYIKQPNKLPFSFYFLPSDGFAYGIRVKPVFNPERLILNKTGTLKLCDDWEYIPGEDDKFVSDKDIRKMKKFFRCYLVLFCAVWDQQMSDGALEDCFYGRLTFNEMLKDLDFYDEYSTELDNIETVEELENFCRKYKLVNLHGN